MPGGQGKGGGQGSVEITTQTRAQLLKDEYSNRLTQKLINAYLINSQLKSCLPNPECIAEYSTLFDGNILHQIYLQIDPEPSFHITKLAGLDDQALILGRVKNFDSIIKNVKALYEEELSMTLLVVPECICLGKSPETREGLENMKLILLLLLGAAVQCPNKELFITRIKELDVDLQHSIVECIKQVSIIYLYILYVVSSFLCIKNNG